MVTRARTIAVAAAAVAIVGLVAAASPSFAAGASITAPESGSKVLSQDPLRVEGSCPAGSRTATVVVASDGKEVAQAAADVGPSLAVRTTLDITGAPTGTGTVVLTCFAYAEEAPLGTAEVEFFLVGADTAPYDVKVSVTPQTVPLGGALTVQTVCDPGTSEATVFLESGDNITGHLFRQATARPRASGAVQWRLPITADKAAGFSPPDIGPALATVVCGDPEPTAPVRTGFGTANFTITAAAIMAQGPPGRSGASAPHVPVPAAPVLATTGDDAQALVTLACALLLLGGAIHLLGQRVGRRS